MANESYFRVEIANDNVNELHERLVKSGPIIDRDSLTSVFDFPRDLDLLPEAIRECFCCRRAFKKFLASHPFELELDDFQQNSVSYTGFSWGNPPFKALGLLSKTRGAKISIRYLVWNIGAGIFECVNGEVTRNEFFGGELIFASTLKIFGERTLIEQTFWPLCDDDEFFNLEQYKSELEASIDVWNRRYPETTLVAPDVASLREEVFGSES